MQLPLLPVCLLPSGHTPLHVAFQLWGDIPLQPPETKLVQLNRLMLQAGARDTCLQRGPLPHLVIFHNDAAHCRIGVRLTQPFARQGQSILHVFPVSLVNTCNDTTLHIRQKDRQKDIADVSATLRFILLRIATH